jgi:osmotically-inducible protein OsmY
MVAGGFLILVMQGEQMNITSKVRVGVLVSLLALGAAGCAGHRGVDQTGEVVEDSWITSKVKSKLVADKEVSGTSIHVKTVDGVVTLGGTASSQAEADRAVQDAQGIKGVKSVVSNIDVK